MSSVYSACTASCPTRRTCCRTSSRYASLQPRHTLLHLANHLCANLQGQERKYFDSGDYALSKAGKAGDVGVTSIGVEHPSPDTIPHLSSSPSTQTPGNPNGNPGLNLQPTQSHQSYVSGSPVKESSILQRGMSVDDQDGDIKSAMEKRAEAASSGLSPSSESDAVPIRQ